jgi:murein DD-endopeptidase MepM/ murein hydrolase activator NlpD
VHSRRGEFVDAVRDSLRLPALGQGNSHPRLQRHALSRRWLSALVLLTVASTLLILGALRTLGTRAHFAAAPAMFRPASAMEARRGDRLVANRQSTAASTTRVEQLDDKGLATKPFTHVIARLTDELPLQAMASNDAGQATAALPGEILTGTSAPPDPPSGATAYAAPDTAAVVEGEALNSSIIVEGPARPVSAPRVVIAKPADTLPQILQALHVEAREIEAISALLAPKGWFKAKAFAGGEKVTVVVDDDDDGAPRDIHPLKVSIERPDAPPMAIARRDDGGFLPVAAPDTAARHSMSAKGRNAAPARPASGTSVRDALYAMAKANDIDHVLIDGMVRLCARDVNIDMSLTGNDTAELLYGRNELGEPELAYAALTLDGKAHRYYRFTAPDDNSTDYYDADGHSVTQSLLRNPVAAGKLGDGFGWRIHPVLHDRRLHEGVDYTAPFGSPIVAAGAGVVELISEQVGYGKYIRVRHDLGYETTYAHISSTARGLRVGSRVRQGETIAFVGSTGYSTGAHLYYELRINGRNVDPLRVRLRAGRMLDGAALDAFETKRDRADLLLRTATADGEPAAVRSESSAQPQPAQPQAEPWWTPVAPPFQP